MIINIEAFMCFSPAAGQVYSIREFDRPVDMEEQTFGLWDLFQTSEMLMSDVCNR